MKLHIPFKLRLIWTLEGVASLLGFKTSYSRLSAQFDKFKSGIYYK